MTCDELVEQVADETVDLLEAIYDDGFDIEDILEVVEAGDKWKHAWNVFSKLEQMGENVTKKDLLMHVVAKLPSRVIAVISPLPEGEIPA